MGTITGLKIKKPTKAAKRGIETPKVLRNKINSVHLQSTVSK